MTFARPTYEEAIARSLKRGARKRGKGLNGARIRRQRAMLTTPPKPGTRRALKKELKSLTAQLVKMRDGHQCGQCAEDGIRTDCVIDAGHVYPVSAFPAVEFDLSNIHGQCRAHNLAHIRNPHPYMDWFIKKFGHAAREELHARALGESPTNEQLEQMIVERTRIVEEMRCHQAAMV